MQIKTFIFYYNSCIHESVPSVMSYHKTKEGAEKAMTLHKEEARAEYNRMFTDDPEFMEMCPFGTHEEWFVSEETINILD